MYSFCDEQLPPDGRDDVRLLSVLLRVCAIWRGEANTLSFKVQPQKNFHPPPEQWPVGFLFCGRDF